ncbi:MAG TPA: hypothetical protein VLQ90_06685 [Pyrinomonadaceae bacterium]|nr:hypothetical protein [Pyrinomonadaceae bacterium]
MKRCPTCLRVYSDDSLKFCRVDGAELAIHAVDSQDTLLKLPALGDNARTTEALGAPALPRLSQITFADAIEEYPAWSPNNEEFAFSREEAGIRSIFRKNIASGEERKVTSGDYDDIQPAWSPEGKTILFVRSRQPKVKLEPGDALAQDVAAIYAGLGDKDQAFAWLEKDFESSSGQLARVRWELPFESLYSDPRFADLLRRMGLKP